MAFLWFGRKKGKREETKEVLQEKKEIQRLTFKHPLLEAAYYHSKQFSKLAANNTDVSRSCAYAEGTATIRCYLQYLCVSTEGGIKNTRAIPVILRQANAKKQQVDTYLSAKISVLNDSAETLYADIGGSKVTLETLETLREIIGKLEIICM